MLNDVMLVSINEIMCLESAGKDLTLVKHQYALKSGLRFFRSCPYVACN